LLILRVLRGAKAPLFHGTTGMQEFFRNLLDKLSLMTRPSIGTNDDDDEVRAKGPALFPDTPPNTAAS
jgi:hypothetical protein